LPIAAIATRNNPRIQAQLGVFTISHKRKIPVEDIEGEPHAIKYVIPSSAKKNISEELHRLSIGKFQVFPELSSIGEKLTERLT
jgi:hypothetical protein